MAHASIPMSQYRADQSRRALHVRALDTSDASVLRTHDFDSEFRSIALALTERIEIALRGRVDRAARHRFASSGTLTRRRSETRSTTTRCCGAQQGYSTEQTTR
jgi:abortive infection bacteriophage resistance protein